MFYTNGIALFRWFYRGLKKKSTKNFRLMFGCLVLMEPVNHSYAVPSFSFRDSNREEKLSGTLSLVYHWPFLRFKTRQKPSAKKKGQKQNRTDCSHKIRWWFSHCHAVQTPIQRKSLPMKMYNFLWNLWIICSTFKSIWIIPHICHMHFMWCLCEIFS